MAGIEITCDEVRAKFAGIEPTEKEKAAGLLHAYKLATVRLEQEENQRRRDVMISETKRMWSFQEQWNHALEIAEIVGKQENFEFILDADNKHVLELLCLYFTNDVAFESFGYGSVPYSLKKGLWLQSPERGTGKTVLLRLFQSNKRSCFHYVNVHNMRYNYAKAGVSEIERVTQLVDCSAGPGTYYQEQKGFMYDEMFGEEKANQMGTAMNISEYVIHRLYDCSKGNDWFWKFHITSNADGEAIEQICGKTVRSRMVEMFNLIKLEGADRRVKRRRGQ